MAATVEEPAVMWTDEDTNELRELVADEDARQWQIGDKLLDKLPVGEKSGGNRGIAQTIREVAAVVGAEPRALVEYRKTAYSWPLGTRVPNATWSAHRAYQGHPGNAGDRHRILSRLAQNEHGYITVKAVRDLTKGTSGTKSKTDRIGEIADLQIKVGADLALFVEKYMKEPPLPEGAIPKLERTRARMVEALAVVDDLLAGEHPDTTALRASLEIPS